MNPGSDGVFGDFFSSAHFTPRTTLGCSANPLAFAKPFVALSVNWNLIVSQARRVPLAALRCVDSLDFKRNCLDGLLRENPSITSPATRTNLSRTNDVFNSMDWFAQPTGNFADS